jgi:beta-galactosidase
MVHILPHWNWQGHEGKSIPVMAYTNADEVELLLNGKSLGKKKRFSEPVDIPVGKNVSSDLNFLTKYRLEWEVPYQSGELKAVAYSRGQQVAEEEVRTAGAPARIVVVPDRDVIRADGNDLSFVTVRIEDKDGNICPTADNLVHFNVMGVGEIAAVDNGNAATTELFQSDHRTAFSGLALLIVRSEKRAGAVRVVASSDGLRSGTAEIRTEPPAEDSRTRLAHLK